MSDRVRQLVVVSDMHFGCKLGLCSPEPLKLDGEGHYTPSEFQCGVWRWWLEFWEWVAEKTKGEPYDIVINGDILEGVHHGAKSQISQNHADQVRLAYRDIRPFLAPARKRYLIRGTEAHGGKNEEMTQMLAQMLHASVGLEISPQGRESWWELWKAFGERPDGEGFLAHFSHHVGTTGSSAYESSAPFKELIEAYVEAGRWGNRPPDVVVRSHRHRSITIEIPSEHTRGASHVTAAWQGKTPFAYKIPGGRQAQPQFGGTLIKQADDGEWYIRPWVKSLARPDVQE